MAPILWSDVTSVAPELANKISDAAQLIVLSIANSQFDVNGWGGETSQTLKDARCLLAAHHGTLMRRKGIGGAVASEGAGGINRSFQNSARPSELNATSYGQLLLALMRTRPFRAGIVPGQWNSGNGGTGWA